MKLEVGMYVRTKWGYICELININDFREPTHKYGVEANYLKDIMFIGDEDVLKASHNIIDLIEVGDFITLGENNYPLQIRSLWEHGGDIHIELSNGARIEDLHYNEDFKIYSIVTKETFESMSYKVGD